MDIQTVRQTAGGSECIQLALDIHYLPHCCWTEIMFSLRWKADDVMKKGWSFHLNNLDQASCPNAEGATLHKLYANAAISIYTEAAKRKQADPLVAMVSFS